ncbi:MAG: nucleotidyltransferase [Flavobacteriaceae bacterium]|nr:nucleotidyltransferase [Flavobacteriaceae bacterium]
MNTIPLRIADHIKNVPPFSYLEKETLYQIASEVVVQYFEKDDSIFTEGGEIKDCFYLVHEGAVGLFSNETTLVEECDEGDLFGLRALIRKDYYKLSAVAIEETILYTIPAQAYEDYLKNNRQASDFIINSFANKLSGKEMHKRLSKASEVLLEDSIRANFSKNPITCSDETSIENAAQIMTVKRVGSLIVEHDKKPLGIVTDKDLRIKVATGKFSIKEKVIHIMSSPVICASPDISIAEAQILMMKHKITHLCITADGTMDTEVIGVLSEHDIILIRENNPSVLIKQIKRSYSASDLKDVKEKSNQLLQQYIQQSASITFVSKIISEINSALTSRAIELAIEDLGSKPPVSFTWLSLGSQGRKEQMLTTDQDNAILYEGKADPASKAYFLKLGKMVTNILHEVGFEYCPAEMMASNEKWCLSMEEWKGQFKKWIEQPTEENIMFCTIFFDFTSFFGNESLITELNDFITNLMKKNKIFLKLLAKNALQNPAPLGFFRQFLVEDSGEHKNQFDIKSRAMMPLVDAARLLTLESGQIQRNTIERFSSLIDDEDHNKEIYENCIEAYKTLLEFRTDHGLNNQNSGRFIVLDDLTKLEKLALKGCFKAVKEIQNLIMVRFQLAQLL